jgi:hypothetical protein
MATAIGRVTNLSEKTPLASGSLRIKAFKDLTLGV